MSTKKKGSVVSHEEGLREDFKSPRFAAEYLKACVEQSASDMPEVVLEAIREVANVHGMAWVAGKIGVDRSAVYRMLSPEGNPSLRNFMAILEHLRIRMTFEPLPKRNTASRMKKEVGMQQRLSGNTKRTCARPTSAKQASGASMQANKGRGHSR